MVLRIVLLAENLEGSQEKFAVTKISLVVTKFFFGLSWFFLF